MQPSPPYRSGTFSSPPRNACLLVITPHFPVSLVTGSLLSVSKDLPVLDVSWKCNYTTCDLSCLAAFAHENFLRSIHFSIYQSFVLFYGQRIFHQMDGRHVVSPVVSWRTLELPPPFAISTPERVFVGCVFSLVLGVYTLWARIAGFNFWGNVQTVFQSSCVILNSHPRRDRVLTAPHCPHFAYLSFRLQPLQCGRWHLAAVLTPIFMMTYDNERLFLCSLVIWTPLESCPFRPFVHFAWGCPFIAEVQEFLLYFGHSLVKYMVCGHFHSFPGTPWYFPDSVVCSWKVLRFEETHLSSHSTWCLCSKKLPPNPRWQRIVPVFILRVSQC